MRIHGRKILGFPCGDVEVEQQICDFYIEEDSHEFVIEVDDYPIEKAFDLLCRNESLHKECLFCVDENEKAFTLYNCYLMPLQIPVRQMKIIWNKCLIILKIYKVKKLNQPSILSRRIRSIHSICLLGKIVLIY